MIKIKSIRSGISIKIGRKEETFMCDKDYDMLYDESSGDILVRHKIFKDDYVRFNRTNVSYMVEQEFQHALFDKPAPKDRVKAKFEATANA